MIGRVWHGWTSIDDAEAYERLLRETIFPAIAAKNIAGYRRLELFRREREGEVEFKTIMWFDTMDAVRAFAGDDYDKAYVPPEARALLARFDARSQHYEVRARSRY